MLCELIAAYYNDSRIADSPFDVVKTRASIVRYDPKELDLISRMLHLESYLHFPKGIDFYGAVEELKVGHRDFCAAVNWLCRPKVTRPALPPEELDKLAASHQLEWGRYPDIDSASENFVRYFEDHGINHLQTHLALEGGKLARFSRPTHVIDLFCNFLITECRDRTPDQMPLRFCPNCGTLFTAMSINGKLKPKKSNCSTRCQQRGWWTKEKRADDMYVKRLSELVENSAHHKKGYSTSDLFRRWERPTVRKRLEQIKNRWTTDWPVLVERVIELEQQVHEIGKTLQERSQNGRT